MVSLLFSINGFAYFVNNDTGEGLFAIEVDDYYYVVYVSDDDKTSKPIPLVEYAIHRSEIIRALRTDTYLFMSSVKLLQSLTTKHLIQMIPYVGVPDIFKISTICFIFIAQEFISQKIHSHDFWSHIDYDISSFIMYDHFIGQEYEFQRPWRMSQYFSFSTIRVLLALYSEKVIRLYRLNELEIIDSSRGIGSKQFSKMIDLIKKAKQDTSKPYNILFD